MTTPAMLRNCVLLALLFTACCLQIGCTSPPSVAPLLRVTQAALEAEASQLEADAHRDAQWIDQTRTALAQAYEADLAQTDELSVQWVRDATSVYVAAREALLQHEMNLKQQRMQRAANLRAANLATQRAQAMLEQQDALMSTFVGIDGWQLLEQAFHPKEQP